VLTETDNPAGRIAAAAARLAAAGPFGEAPPWRGCKDPYAVFLAEFLLVRTRADVVKRVWKNLLERYPCFEALAWADERDLAELVAPLGLRKRVPLLLKAASYVVAHYGGVLPERPEELAAVPGMGPYTAAAVAAFAFGARAVPADVNVLRFLSRFTGIAAEHPTKGNCDLRALAAELAQAGSGPDPGSFIDFTRTVCRPRKPRCGECPVADLCHFAVTGGCLSGVPIKQKVRRSNGRGFGKRRRKGVADLDGR